MLGKRQRVIFTLAGQGDEGQWPSECANGFRRDQQIDGSGCLTSFDSHAR